MAATHGIGLDSPHVAGRTALADPPAGIPANVRGSNDAPGARPPAPFARLGTWAATHFRRVLMGWVLVVLVFGIFAIHVENALAGAGWQASNSQSVAARAIVEKHFSGLGATGLQVVVVDHHGPIAGGPQGPGRNSEGDPCAPRRSAGLDRRATSSRRLGVARRSDGNHHRRIRRQLQQDGASGRLGAAEVGGSVLVRRHRDPYGQ